MSGFWESNVRETYSPCLFTISKTFTLYTCFSFDDVQWSPRELINQHKLDATKHCQNLFCAYCKVHDEPELMNWMYPCMHGAIAICPTGKLQGLYNFVWMALGKKIIIERRWTELPMPQSAEMMAEQDGNINGLWFLNQRKQEYNFLRKMKLSWQVSNQQYFPTYWQNTQELWVNKQKQMKMTKKAQQWKLILLRCPKNWRRILT